MKKGIYVNRDKLMIQGDRLLLVLTPKEIIDAVLRDEALFIKSCKRGKSELRYMQNERRMQKAEERAKEDIRRNEAEQMQEVLERE